MTAGSETSPHEAASLSHERPPTPLRNELQVSVAFEYSTLARECSLETEAAMADGLLRCLTPLGSRRILLPVALV